MGTSIVAEYIAGFKNVFDRFLDWRPVRRGASDVKNGSGGVGDSSGKS
jgi:hypothetical protein